MIGNFAELTNMAKKSGPVRVAVAAADDTETLLSVKSAVDLGFAGAILVGNADKIEKEAKSIGLNSGFEIIDVQDPLGAARTAVQLVREKKAEVLMKGLLNTSDFLRSVLKSLRKGRLLSHLAVFDIPGEKKLFFQTDGGMNVLPDLDEKTEILHNSVAALHALKYEGIKIACLAANEKVDEKMPATIHARSIQEAAGQFPGCIIEGPIALDVALSPESARHKDIESRISGDTDLFLVPSIEAGNILGKTLVHYAKAVMAGVILGASCPIVMTSRSESAEGKRSAIALACLLGTSV